MRKDLDLDPKCWATWSPLKWLLDQRAETRRYLEFMGNKGCVDVGDPATGFGRADRPGHAEEGSAGVPGANVVHPALLLFLQTLTAVACGPENREPHLPPAPARVNTMPTRSGDSPLDE